MTPEEANESYWDYQPVLLILDDGTALCPMSDDEGNNAGALCHLGGEQETIPVMRWMMNKEFIQFKSDVLKELSELIKIIMILSYAN